MLWHSKSAVSMTFVFFSIAKLKCQMLTIIGYFFLFLICLCMICLNKNMQKKWKAKRSKMLLNMVASVYSRRCESYRMYFEGDSPHQTVMILYELKWFSHILNHHNMYTLMQSCNIFHTQHAIFFATLNTCAGTMWFDHHKVLHVLMYAH